MHLAIKAQVPQIATLVFFSFIAIPIAFGASITLKEFGTPLPNGTQVFKSNDLSFSGTELPFDFGQIGSITLTDDGSADGGAPGAFSGFDLDAFFLVESIQLDASGVPDLSSIKNPSFADLIRPMPGMVRPTTNPLLLYDQINANNPGDPVLGPLFGHDNSSDGLQQAARDALRILGEGSSEANVNLPPADISLGDGGSILGRFNKSRPSDTSGKTLFLVIGEVGAQENVADAGVSVEITPVPEPATGVMLFSGLLGLGIYRWRQSYSKK